MNILYRFLGYKILNKIWNKVFSGANHLPESIIEDDEGSITPIKRYSYTLDGSATDLRRFNSSIKKLTKIYLKYTMEELYKDKNMLSLHEVLTLEIDEFTNAYNTGDVLQLNDFLVSDEYKESVGVNIDKYVKERERFKRN